VPNIDQLPNKSAEAWTWLARLLNNQEVSALTADIILHILKIAGHCLLQQYGVQFQKVLQFVQDVYLPRIPPSGDSSRRRIQIFLQKYRADGGRIQKPVDEGLRDT